MLGQCGAFSIGGRGHGNADKLESEAGGLRAVYGSKLVFFVLEINGALCPRTKEIIDDLQAAVKLKGHARFSFRVFAFTRCAVAGRLPPNNP